MVGLTAVCSEPSSADLVESGPPRLGTSRSSTTRRTITAICELGRLLQSLCCNKSSLTCRTRYLLPLPRLSLYDIESFERCAPPCPNSPEDGRLGRIPYVVSRPSTYGSVLSNRGTLPAHRDVIGCDPLLYVRRDRCNGREMSCGLSVVYSEPPSPRVFLLPLPITNPSSTSQRIAKKFTYRISSSTLRAEAPQMAWCNVL